MRNKYRPPNSLMTKVALVRGEKRRDHEITRRTDFGFIPGKVISYRFAKKHPPTELLAAEKGDLVHVVLYNLNTRQLDEIVFTLRSRSPLGQGSPSGKSNGIEFHGLVEGCEYYTVITIYYYYRKKSRFRETISVCHAAPPYDPWAKKEM